MKWRYPQEWLKFFKAVCDNNRQTILGLIKNQERINATDIIKKIELSQPTVSHHLKILTEAALIIADKQGKEIFYSINKEKINQCCGGFMKKFLN